MEISKLTNSEIGSYHWFHTLMSFQKHVGEFLKDKSPTEEILRQWGKQLEENSMELIQGFNKITLDK